MTSDALAYTVFDDFARSFDTWLSQTPYWMVALVVAGLAAIFIFSMVKKFVFLSVLVLVATAIFLGFWFYATSFV